MTGHQYLQNILIGQDLGENELNQLRSLREEIEGVLRDTFGSEPRFYYAGSYGKKTMIKEAYDLDIVMYFPSTVNYSVKDIYISVLRTLVNKKYPVHPKTVAIRIPSQGGFHIDVVPGKAQDVTYYYATLYKNGEYTTMDLAKSTWNVFIFIRDNIERVRLIDPANSNNEIAMPTNTRLLLKAKATSATQAQNWGQIIW